MSSCKLYHDFILAPIKCQNKNNNNKKLAAKGERFVSLLFRTAIAYYVRTPFPLPSLLLQGLGTTQARVNRLYLAWFLNIASYNNTPLTEIKY